MRARLKYVLCVLGLLASISDASPANDLNLTGTQIAAAEVTGKQICPQDLLQRLHQRLARMPNRPARL